ALPSPEKLESANRELTLRSVELARLNEELGFANGELESFSYSVSHDLRAPLRGIDGFTSALLEEYGDKLDSEGKRYIQRVRGATQRMGALIDDLLALARVTRAEMKPERVDLTRLGEKVAGVLQESTPERQVTFQIQNGLEASADSSLMRI